jgi:hypothetical protein
VRLVGPATPLIQRFHVTLGEPLDGIAVQNVTADREGVTLVLRAESAKLKPGFKGNLILSAFAERAAAPANGRPGAARRPPMATLPAIPIEIVQP